MVKTKNNFLKNILGRNDDKKNLKKLQKNYDDYNILNKKFIEGEINNKELQTYYSLKDNIKEEISKMSEKIKLQDGKFVLNKETPQQPSATEQSQQPQQNIEKMPTQQPSVTERQQPTQEEIQAYHLQQQLLKQRQEERLRQQQYEQPQPTPEEIEQERYEEIRRRHQTYSQPQRPTQEQVREQQYQEQLRQQQSQEYNRQIEEQNRIERINDLKQKLPPEQFEAFMRREQQKQEEESLKQRLRQDGHVMVVMLVKDVPELQAKIQIGNEKAFLKMVEDGIKTNTPFPFANVMVNPANILIYRIL